MRRTSAVPIAVALPLLSVVLLAAACGGSSAADPAKSATSVVSTTATPRPQPSSSATVGVAAPTPAVARMSVDDGSAALMLLSPSDFPAGWVHKPADASDDPEAPPAADTPDPLKKCFTGVFVGQTGRAIGGEYSDSDTTMLSINPSVYVFDTAEHAQQAAQTIVSDVQCFADAVGNGLDVDASFGFGKTYTAPLDPRVFGATAALRSFDTQIYKDEQPPHSDILVFDVVVTVRGRILTEIDGFQRYSPIDQALLRRYVDKAQAKIEPQP